MDLKRREITIIETKIEMQDRSIRDYNIKGSRDGNIITITCMRGTRTAHKYRLNTIVWREIENNGKLNFNRLVFLNKKVPESLDVGISNIRSKILDAEIKLILKLINE